MHIILTFGILIFVGYILGELANWIKLPRVSGYIIAGILLNPGLFGFVTPEFVVSTSLFINISLTVITFSIGGSLSKSKMDAGFKSIIVLTIFEALFAYIFVFAGIFLLLNFFLNIFDSLIASMVVSLLLASLAAPTDPTATLAVIQQYKAKGKVSSTLLGIAAFDDIIGIVLFTLTLAVSKSLVGSAPSDFSGMSITLLRNIGGALIIGSLMGLLLNSITKLFNKDSEGSLIVIVIGTLALCYGIVNYLHMDALLSTMSMGIVVVNFNKNQEKIFNLLERYTEELIFVIFFTLSGLHLQLSTISGSLLLIVFYILFRALGKFTGIYSGATILKESDSVKKYTAGGLLPQGGIVIGLALLASKEKAFSEFASLIIGVVIGSAVIHELIGPVFSRLTLKKAHEIALPGKESSVKQSPGAKL